MYSLNRWGNFFKTIIQNAWFRLRFKTNSKNYWNARFKTNWTSYGGRLQTAFFALAYISTRPSIYPDTILEFGCGAGDALPVLKLMFPKSKLYYYDFSTTAMKLAANSYGNFAEPWRSNGSCELVYCSNVIEHIDDIDTFLKKLECLSSRYLVILAPYNEKHQDGSTLSTEYPKDEHVRTIIEGVVEKCLNRHSWTHEVLDLPWDPTKRQIVLLGELSK